MNWRESKLTMRSLKGLAVSLVLLLGTLALWHYWVERGMEALRATTDGEAEPVWKTQPCPRIRYSHLLPQPEVIGDAPFQMAVFTVENESAQKITLLEVIEVSGDAFPTAVGARFAVQMGSHWWESGRPICAILSEMELWPGETRHVQVNAEPLMRLPDGMPIKMGMGDCWSEPFASQQVREKNPSR